MHKTFASINKNIGSSYYGTKNKRDIIETYIYTPYHSYMTMPVSHT